MTEGKVPSKLGDVFLVRIHKVSSLAVRQVKEKQKRPMSSQKFNQVFCYISPQQTKVLRSVYLEAFRLAQEDTDVS